MKKDFKSILVYNTFGIGDVVFSTPVVKALRKRYPCAKITFVCNERVYHVLKRNPFIDNVIKYEKDYYRTLARTKKTKYIKKVIKLLMSIKALKADLMVDLSLNYQASLVCMLLGIPYRIGFNYRNRGRFLNAKVDLEGFDKKHVVYYYLEIIKLIGIECDNCYPEIFTSPEEDEWAENFFKEKGFDGKLLVGMAPGGGMSWGDNAKYRRWPAENFAKVADSISNRTGATIILVGESKEAAICAEVERNMKGKVINVCGTTGVGQFMSIVKKCALLICNEGGPLHVAVALNVPTVSIFGPVDENVYGPFGKDRDAHMIIAERQICKPCYSRFRHKDCDNVICLKNLDAAKVTDASFKLLERISGTPIK